MLIHDIHKLENPTPRAQITSMFKSVSKDECSIDRYDRKAPKFKEIMRSIFHWQTHAKLQDNLVEDGFFNNVLWKLNKRYLCPSKTYMRTRVLEETITVAKNMLSKLYTTPYRGDYHTAFLRYLVV